MVEHNIRTWAKENGSWDVTHHKSGYGDGPYLYDVEKDFRNFKTRELAEAYAFRLFKRFFKKGNLVELSSPSTWGQQAGKYWTAFQGDSWMIRLDGKGKIFFWSSPANPNDTSKIPKNILSELKSKMIIKVPSIAVK